MKDEIRQRAVPERLALSGLPAGGQAKDKR
jgi:hypothetical protein